MGHIPLTYNQKVALIAWYLAHGEGLTNDQIRRLTRIRRAEQVLERVKRIIPLTQDAAETWSWTGATVEPPQIGRRNPRRGHDPYEAERAALVAFYLATRGEVYSPQIAQQLGITRQGALRLLYSLSVCLPLYLDDRRIGRWCVLDFRDCA